MADNQMAGNQTTDNQAIGKENAPRWRVLIVTLLATFGVVGALLLLSAWLGFNMVGYGGALALVGGLSYAARLLKRIRAGGNSHA